MNFKPNVIKYKSKQSENTEIICIVAFCDIINVNEIFGQNKGLYLKYLWTDREETVDWIARGTACS